MSLEDCHMLDTLSIRIFFTYMIMLDQDIAFENIFYHITAAVQIMFFLSVNILELPTNTVMFLYQTWFISWISGQIYVTQNHHQ